jgi:hypothetical protein
MFFERRNANAVLLPDDTVLVVGGNRTGGQTDPVYTAEAYDVVTDTWRLLPAMNRMRVYHSTALLLPDGRVWACGTFADQDYAEKNIEVYSPGYLFDFAGARPVITSAPSVIHYGTVFSVVATPPIGSIRLIRLGVATHSTNMDQRAVGLSFAAEAGTLTVTAPADANVAPPGLYMLFVLRPKLSSLSGESAVPSVAKIVQVKRPVPP